MSWCLGPGSLCGWVGGGCYSPRALAEDRRVLQPGEEEGVTGLSWKRLLQSKEEEEECVTA